MAESGNEILTSPKTAALSEALRLCRVDLDGQDGDQLQRSLDDIVEASLRLRDVGDCAFYLRGGLLNQLYMKGKPGKAHWALHVRGKDMAWPQYCEEVLNQNAKSANAARRLYTRAVELGISPEVLEKVGWCRARLMLRVADKDSLNDWLEAARSAPSVRAFAKQVRTTTNAKKAKREADIGEYLSPMRFMVSDDQRQNILQGIEDARRIAAKSNPVSAPKIPDAALLDLLVTDWRANHYDNKVHSLAWCLRQIERTFGVSVAIASTAAAPEVEAPEESLTKNAD